MAQLILKGLDPKLDDILKDTYYQLIYQEQAMEICIKIAGYSMGKADTVRKTIGRKIQSELDVLMPDLISKFQSYGGLSKDKAEYLGTALQACASYCFNKSHSVEYGLISYQTAYLKANYPVEYMCSLLNGNSDTIDDMVKYISECQRMGIEILPPSVKVGNLRFKPEDTKIRVGLSCIKGINQLSYTYYDDIQEFFNNNSFNKRVKEALIKSGALDCFGISRRELLNIALDIHNEIQNEQDKIFFAGCKIIEKNKEIDGSKDKTTKKVALLKRQIANQKEIIKKSQQRIDELSGLARESFDEISGETEVLGFTFKDRFAKYDKTDYNKYNPELSMSQTILAEVIEFKQIKDKKQRDMAFVKIQPCDTSGIVELVMFSSAFKVLLEKEIYAITIKNMNQIQSIGKAKIKEPY